MEVKLEMFQTTHKIYLFDAIQVPTYSYKMFFSELMQKEISI